MKSRFSPRSRGEELRGDVDRRCVADFDAVIGVDEVGRGAIAGPLVVGAARFSSGFYENCSAAPQLAQIRDSKTLSAKKRNELAAWIKSCPWVSIKLVWVSAAQIDASGLGAALQHGFSQAARALLGVDPGRCCVLVDGSRPIVGLDAEQIALVQGDDRSHAVAMASIVAKVARDRYMREVDGRFCGYEFAAHVGYPTADHRAALARQGPCGEHRRSVATLRRTCP